MTALRRRFYFTSSSFIEGAGGTGTGNFAGGRLPTINIIRKPVIKNKNKTLFCNKLIPNDV
jgi:hypothetical protein